MRSLGTNLLYWIFATLLVVASPSALAGDFIVYSIYKSLDLGNPGEISQKDYYVNVGSEQGLAKGATLEVIRRAATYDLTTQKLYRDTAFPIAKLRVIHVEPTLSIARLDSLAAPEKTPAANPRAVMVGDVVRPAK